MGQLDKFIYLAFVILILMLLFFFNKNKQFYEKFENVFHITGENNYQFDKIILNPSNNNAKYDNDGLYLNTAYVTTENKLFVGNSSGTDTNFTSEDFRKLYNTNFPYIEKTANGDRLYFNRFDKYLDADNLRALKGQKLIPLYNKGLGVNRYALKLEGQPYLFETNSLRCGFKDDDVNNQGRITGIIQQEKSY